MNGPESEDGLPPEDNWKEKFESALSSGNILYPVSAGLVYGLERNYRVNQANVGEILASLEKDIQLLSALCDRAMADESISMIEMGAKLATASRPKIRFDFCAWSEVLGNRACVLTHEGNMSYVRSNSRLRKMRMDSRAKNIGDLQILCEAEATIFFLEDLIRFELEAEVLRGEEVEVSFTLQFSSDVVRTKL